MKTDFNETLDCLRSGKVILCPTDTIWGISCDATNAKAVQRIFELKKRAADSSFIVLVNSLDMLGLYINTFPDFAVDLIEFAESPLTIIFPEGVKLAAGVINSDGTVAVRLVNTSTEEGKFCSQLIRYFNKPIVSTSANISGQPAPKVFAEISEEIKTHVDHIVPYFRTNFTERKPSRIIKLEEGGRFKIIR